MKYKSKRFVQRIGCKQSIAFDLFEIMRFYVPDYHNRTFIDLFGGGGSMSANATYFFKNVVYNEVNKGVVDLFIAVQDDNFLKNLKGKWISRDVFSNILKDGYKNAEENMILTTWSFGNNRSAYIYGKNIEIKKYLTHKIIFSNTEVEYKGYIKQYNDEKVAHFEKYGAIWDCYLYDNDWGDFSVLDTQGRRYYKFGKRSNYYRKFYKGFDLDNLIECRGCMTSLQDKRLIEDVKKIYNDLQSLERLERLQSLESLERLEIFNKSYEDIKLPKPKDCIIYCDPPYRGTMDYEIDFDFNKFDEYLLGLKDIGYTIFVSEYNLPFGEVVWSKKKRGFKSQTMDKQTGLEKLYLVN